jgi:hypothetical protein
VVARPGIEDVAVAHDAFEGAQQLLSGDLLVDVVHLVEIDPVGLQPAQRCGEVLADLVRGESRVVVGQAQVAHRVYTLVARTTSSRIPGRAANHVPMISSERPLPASAP